MKLFIGSDHAGFDLKEALKKSLQVSSESGRPDERLTIEWVDVGTASLDSVHYPDFAHDLSRRILKERSRDELLRPCGILICGSGVGMSIAANRHAGIRAALVESPEIAALSRQHNASNVLCLGARFLTPDRALMIVKTWLQTPFEGGRHADRVRKIEDT